jgi:membrane complex biogenesis BtpA family protein
MQLIFIKPIIAVVYLPPLAGYLGYKSDINIIEHSDKEIKILIKSGVDAILLENENDRPYTILASDQVINSFTNITKELVRRNPTIKIGLEFLINDPKASLRIAKDSGASFIRTDYFVDRMSREEYGGELYINPSELMKYRDKIEAGNIDIYTDIQVKYAKMLEDKSIEESASQARIAGSDGVIVSSDKTGKAPSKTDLNAAKLGHTKVLIGSGLSLENLSELYPLCDGAMVGSALMEDGHIIEGKTIAFMNKVRELREELK